jgi:HD-like signal output (HDOD) protein
LAYTLEFVDRRIEDAIPALSPTAAKVMRLANDINCSPGALTRVIKLDPVLSARVLRLVNSAYFHPAERIVSLERAVIMLGLNTIKNLALSAAVLAIMKRGDRDYAFDVKAFWEHSLGVGAASKLIAIKRAIPPLILEDYFVAGLLHNMGILVENNLFPKEMRRIVEAAGSDQLLAIEEAELGGLNHCQIGEALALKWNLPEDFAHVMAHYRDLEVEGDNVALVLTVHLASAICRNRGVGLVLDETPISIEPSVYQNLNLEPSVEEEIQEMLEGEIENATEFLQQ